MYHCLPQTQLNRLQHIQNALARAVVAAPRSNNPDRILKLLRWLTVQEHIGAQGRLASPKAVERHQSAGLSPVGNAFLTYFWVTEHFWRTEKCDVLPSVMHKSDICVKTTS